LLPRFRLIGGFSAAPETFSSVAFSYGMWPSLSPTGCPAATADAVTVELSIIAESAST